MNIHSALFALGALVLGAVGLYFHDFALTWQPVPKGIAHYTPLAYASGALLLLGGALVLTGKAARLGAWLLTLFFGSWVVLLHLPKAVAGWKHIGAWLGAAELTFVTMGGLALLSGNAGDFKRPFALVARLLAGASAIVFGLTHFSYIGMTADMVPKWLPPSTVFWAWATGAGHLAAGIALVSGWYARLAGACLAGMMASFVLLVHVPGVVGAPGDHKQWAMLGIATTLTGAAWLVRKFAT